MKTFYNYYDFCFDPAQDVWNVYRLYCLRKKHSDTQIAKSIYLRWNETMYLASFNRVKRGSYEKSKQYDKERV